jgi:antitoxin PrlF
MKKSVSCCKVGAVVTMDSKGQIVLPKDLRDKAKLKPDDKLAVIACEEDGEVNCIMLVRAAKLEDKVRETLGPMLREIFEERR